MAFSIYLFSVKGSILIILFMIITARNFGTVKTFENYGPYTAHFRDFQYCSGPKSRNLTYNKVEMTKIGNDYIANVYLSFLTQCHIDEVKIKILKVEKDQKILLFNYKIENPCQHFAFSSLIQSFVEANKCWVKKGAYNFTINLNNVCRTFYGESFFYGEFQTRTTVISKQGNIICWVVNNIYSK